MILQKLMKLLRTNTVRLVLVLLVTCTALSGCSATKKNNCGCPNKKGMVGY
ncbi:MAG: hypothetical protein ACOVP6_10630 [Lacibacter sp.]|jgi:hypothetical protein